MKHRASTLCRPDASGRLVYHSLGRRMFCRVLEDHTLEDVCKLTGKTFTVGAASAWATGARTPTRYADRAAIERAFLIPAEAFDWPDTNSPTVEENGNIVSCMKGPRRSPSRFSVTLPPRIAARIEALRDGNSMATTLAALVTQGLDLAERDRKKPHTAA